LVWHVSAGDPSSSAALLHCPQYELIDSTWQLWGNVFPPSAPLLRTAVAQHSVPPSVEPAQSAAPVHPTRSSGAHELLHEVPSVAISAQQLSPVGQAVWGHAPALPLLLPPLEPPLLPPLEPPLLPPLELAVPPPPLLLLPLEPPLEPPPEELPDEPPEPPPGFDEPPLGVELLHAIQTNVLATTAAPPEIFSSDRYFMVCTLRIEGPDASMVGSSG
jgi:hypothetical protein